MTTHLPLGTIHIWTIPCNSAHVRRQLEQAGITIVETIKGLNGSSVVKASLPVQWNIRPMLTVDGESPHQAELLDDRHRVRAGIVHRSANGARWSTIHMRRRYSVGLHNDEVIVAYVNDGATDRRIYQTSGYYFDSPYHSFRRQYELAIQEVRTWLNLHYPGWRDVNAYWD